MSIKVNHLQVSGVSYPLFTLAQNCIKRMKLPAFLIVFCVIAVSYVSAAPIGEGQLQIVRIETVVLQWKETDIYALLSLSTDIAAALH